jgi:2-polyprenyl-3-methyl-5-hydroxy-6-metoxy-1,4-benzoquinol methylase
MNADAAPRAEKAVPADFEARFDAALDQLRREAQDGGSAVDLDYLAHAPRYRRTVRRVLEIAPPGASLLDVGSHFLHLATLLGAFGYRVTGLDVPVFAEAEVVRRRAGKLGIENHSCAHFEAGDFLAGREERFDMVLFLEILEHITFNPIRFWRRIYDLLAPGGLIYLTTPNGTRAWAVLSAVKNALLLRCIGASLREILGVVTYGHHWKEYSGPEIRSLFAMLSPDFDVHVSYYRIRPFDPRGPRSIRMVTRDTVRRLATLIPRLDEEIDAVIRLPRKSGGLAVPPTFT